MVRFAKFVRRSKTILIKTPLGPTKYYRGTLIYYVCVVDVHCSLLSCVCVFYSFFLLRYIKFSIRSPQSDQKCTRVPRGSFERASTDTSSRRNLNTTASSGRGRKMGRGFLRLFDLRSGDVGEDSGNDLVLLIDSSLHDFITFRTREKPRTKIEPRSSWKTFALPVSKKSITWRTITLRHVTFDRINSYPGNRSQQNYIFAQVILFACNESIFFSSTENVIYKKWRFLFFFSLNYKFWSCNATKFKFKRIYECIYI